MGVQSTTNTDFRVEDGFVRSRGLGAELVPALSLCLDQRGIYYDPRGPVIWKAFCKMGASYGVIN